MKNFKVIPSRLSVRLSVALAIANLFSAHTLAQTPKSPNLSVSNVSGDYSQHDNDLIKKVKKTTEVEQIIVTASRIQSSINEIPASISVIDKERLEQLSANKLSDLLRYQAGISVEKSGDRHGDANINIRGIGGNRILMVKDGTIMPDGFGSAGVSQGRGNFDPFNLQQVEILKGPASALYGSNALGGVVIMNTLDPEHLVTGNNNEAFISVNGGYFTEDDRYRLGITTASELAGGYLLFQTQHQTFHELDKNSDFVVNPKNGQSDSLFVKWKYEDDVQKFRIIADYFNQDVFNQLNTNIGPIAGPPGTEITSATADDDSLVWRLSFQHEYFNFKFIDSFKWQLDYQHSNYEQFEQETTENNGSVRPPIPASKILLNEWEDFKQKQISLNLQLEKEYGNHEVLLGIDYLMKSIVRPVNRLKTDLISGNSTSVINGYQHPGKTFPDANVTQLGIFVQDYLTISDDLTMIMGLRYDKFENSPKPDQAYQNYNVANAVIKDFSDDAISPHIGLIYQLNDEVSLFGNVTTGFRAPPIAEQYISRAILIPVPGAPHEVIPNNELTSEKSLGKEIGIRWNNDLAGLELSIYQNNYDDFIDSKTIGYREMPPVFTGPLAIRQIQYQNVDEVEIKGLELTGHILLDQWLPNNWQGNSHLALSVIDGENSNDGSGLNSVPPNSGVLGINISPSEVIDLDWHIRATAKGDDTEPLFRHGRPLPTFEPAGYAVQDISIRYRPWTDLAVSLSVYNLTDKKYWASHTKGDNANGNLDATVAPGRNFAITASYQF